MDSSLAHPDVKDSLAAQILFSEFGNALDSKNWTAYAGLFGPDGHLILAGGDPIPQSQLEAICEAVLGGFRVTHHMITNVLSTPDRDGSRVTANLRATHFYPEEHREPWVVGGRYVAHTYLSENRLVFRSVELDFLWQTGDAPA
jgi:hypothetical protein